MFQHGIFTHGQSEARRHGDLIQNWPLSSQQDRNLSYAIAFRLLETGIKSIILIWSNFLTPINNAVVGFHSGYQDTTTVLVQLKNRIEPK